MYNLTHVFHQPGLLMRPVKKPIEFLIIQPDLRWISKFQLGKPWDVSSKVLQIETSEKKIAKKTKTTHGISVVKVDHFFARKTTVSDSDQTPIKIILATRR